ncbi:hypothetical protein [Pseudoalteromonas mariniglutinosa]|uniref:hypothetical protein n=1 Tax=Pseudoalteromonas mariniglutinosa TaxID=206042 RepID=UPI00384BACE8
MRSTILAVLLLASLLGCSESPTKQTSELKPTTDNNSTKATLLDLKSSEGLTDSNSSAEKVNRLKAAPDKADITAAQQQLEQLITDPHCDNNSQCKVLAVGRRACGGPSSYIVYSTKMTIQDEVEKLAKHITTLESQYNTANNMMSICQHLTTPQAQCSNNNCVKIKGSPASVY